VCFVFGSLMLFDPAGSAYQVSLPAALAIAGCITLFFAFAVAKVVQVRRSPVAVGTSTLAGAPGIVRRGGLVAIKGELWQARSSDGEPLTTGDEVVVEDVEEGLRLVVRRPGAAEREEHVVG
jgi:membrane-bound serine protease (ClpP class)